MVLSKWIDVQRNKDVRMTVSPPHVSRSRNSRKPPCSRRGGAVHNSLTSRHVTISLVRTSNIHETIKLNNARQCRASFLLPGTSKAGGVFPTPSGCSVVRKENHSGGVAAEGGLLYSRGLAPADSGGAVKIFKRLSRWRRSGGT